MNEFQEIITKYKSIQGWCSLRKSLHLASLVVATNSTVSVELGVWGGASSIPMALAHKFIGKGILWAVDPWSASASIIDQNAENQAFWGNQQMHDLVYQDFMKNLINLQLNDYIKVIRSTSDKAQLPEIPIEVLSVDGNHGKQVIQDITKWAPRVGGGGYVCLDDMSWDGGSVMEAIHLLKTMGFREVSRHQNGRTDREKDDYAVFQKII